jgi:hypothetical protein
MSLERLSFGEVRDVAVDDVGALSEALGRVRGDQFLPGSVGVIKQVAVYLVKTGLFTGPVYAALLDDVATLIRSTVARVSVVESTLKLGSFGKFIEVVWEFLGTAIAVEAVGSDKPMTVKSRKVGKTLTGLLVPGAYGADQFCLPLSKMLFKGLVGCGAYEEAGDWFVTSVKTVRGANGLRPLADPTYATRIDDIDGYWNVPGYTGAVVHAKVMKAWLLHVCVWPKILDYGACYLRAVPVCKRVAAWALGLYPTKEQALPYLEIVAGGQIPALTIDGCHVKETGPLDFVPDGLVGGFSTVDEGFNEPGRFDHMADVFEPLMEILERAEPVQPVTQSNISHGRPLDSASRDPGDLLSRDGISWSNLLAQGSPAVDVYRSLRYTVDVRPALLDGSIIIAGSGDTGGGNMVRWKSERCAVPGWQFERAKVGVGDVVSLVPGMVGRPTRYEFDTSGTLTVCDRIFCVGSNTVVWASDAISVKSHMQAKVWRAWTDSGGMVIDEQVRLLHNFFGDTVLLPERGHASISMKVVRLSRRTSVGDGFDVLGTRCRVDQTIAEIILVADEVRQLGFGRVTFRSPHLTHIFVGNLKVRAINGSVTCITSVQQAIVLMLREPDAVDVEVAVVAQVRDRLVAGIQVL